MLEGFLEGSLKEVLLRRVLRRRLLRVSVRTGVLRRVLRRERCIEGALKAETRPFAEYDPLRVHPFFLFLGLRLYGVYPSFRTYGVYPFSLVFAGKWYTPQLFLLCDLGVGRQTEKRGVPRWWCILFFPWSREQEPNLNVKVFETPSGHGPPVPPRCLPPLQATWRVWALVKLTKGTSKALP